MTTRSVLAAGALAIIGVAGVTTAAVATDISPLSATATTTSTVGQMGCNDMAVQLTPGECQASGIIAFVSLHNLQGALQFCKWKAANPGEWSRLKAYASTETTPTGIVTWFGGHIYNDLQAYFATGAPTFTIAPNTAPNVCKTPLPPPVVAGVTPGQTDATVTIQTTP